METENRNLKKPWFTEIQILRGFAILAIVMFHCFLIAPLGELSSFGSNPINSQIITINNYVRGLLTHSLAWFILISGFTLALKYSSKFNLLTFYKNRFWSIVPAYLIFSLISIIGTGLLNGFPDIKEIVFSILTASASDPLWFIALIIELYILYPLVIYIYNYLDNRKMKLIGAISVLLLFLMIPAWNWFSPYLSELFKNSPYVILLDRVFIPYLLYFVVGIFCVRNYARIKNLISRLSKYWVIAIAILLVASDILMSKLPSYPGHQLVSAISGNIYTFGMLVVFLKISIYLSSKQSLMSSTVNSFGSYAFGIYLIHPILQYIFCMALLKMNLTYNNWVLYPVLFALTFGFSYICAYVVSYLPFSKLIVGVHRDLGNGKNSKANLGMPSN